MKKISLDSICNPEDRESAEHRKLAAEIRSAAIRHIGIARKSSGQVQRFLEGQFEDRNLIESTIADLIEEGTIDDRRVANRILRDRQSGKLESRVAVLQRMDRLGIRRDIAQDVTSDMRPDADTADELVRDKFAREIGLFRMAGRDEKRKLLSRMNRFLQSRGYSADTACIAISRALAQDNDLSGLNDTADLECPSSADIHDS